MGKERPPKVEVVDTETTGNPVFKIKKEESVEVVEVKQKLKLKGGGGKEGSADVGGLKRAASSTADGEDAKRARTVS
jgi:hypothetical protein